MHKNLIGQSAAVLNSNFIAIMMIKDRHIVWANAAMHGIFGYEPDELIDQPIQNLFLDLKSYENFTLETHLAISKGETYTGTVPQKRKDGTMGWYEINISSLAGSPEMIVGAIVDRTARYQSIQQLEASESRYRSVVEDQTEIICRFLPDGTFVFVNDVFCKLFGKAAHELIGHSWHPVVHPDDLSMIEACLHKISPDSPTVTIENRVIVDGGELRWMQFINRGFYDVDGTLKEIQSVGRDISRLKQIESELRESDERLEMALVGSGLVLWDWNIPEHKITTGSRWFELLGYTNEELGTDEENWMTLINPKHLERFKQQISSHLQGETAQFESEQQLRHKNGHWISVEAKGKVIRRDKDNTPLRMVGTVLDITQRKRLNEEGMGLLKRIESLILETSKRSPVNSEKGKVAESLTKRQKQILGMIAIGMTSPEIAQRLHLATHTVISHRRNIMTKLDLHSTAEVTRFAIEHGLLVTN